LKFDGQKLILDKGSALKKPVIVSLSFGFKDGVISKGIKLSLLE
jgi:hypothetical protein